MTIVLIPAPRPDISGPTALPDFVPAAWLDDATLVLPRRATKAPEPKPIEWQPAGTVRDLVHVKLTSVRPVAQGHGAVWAVVAAAGLTVAAAGCLWGAHLPDGSTPAPVPAIAPAPSHTPDCELNPAACALRVVPVAAVKPLTLAEALGMAEVVAP